MFSCYAQYILQHKVMNGKWMVRCKEVVRNKCLKVSFEASNKNGSDGDCSVYAFRTWHDT